MDVTISSTSQAPSRQKTLETPELLENILLHLDIQTLLVSAQRVSRSWNALISTSPALQKALFLQVEDLDNHADEAGEEERTSAQEGQQPLPRPLPNLLLMRYFPLWFRETQTRSSLLATSYSDSDSDSGSNPDSDGDDGLDDSDAPNSNPGTPSNADAQQGVIRFVHPSSDDSEADDKDDEGWDLLFPYQRDYAKQPFADSQKREAFEYPAASWRKMLVYQSPPIRTVAVWEHVTVDDHDVDRDEFSCTVFCVGGVRTKSTRPLFIGATDREGKAGSDVGEETLEEVVEGLGDENGDSGDGEIEACGSDIAHGPDSSHEDGHYDDSDDLDGKGLRTEYKEVFSSLDEWKTDGEQHDYSKSSATADGGLRMGDYFNFTVYQACRGGARKLAHWPWAGAGSGHYVRKYGRGLGRYGPVPREVRTKWDMVAGGVDVVLTSSYEVGFCGIDGRQQDLANRNFRMEQKGMESPVKEGCGLKKVWHWSKHYGDPE